MAPFANDPSVSTASRRPRYHQTATRHIVASGYTCHTPLAELAIPSVPLPVPPLYRCLARDASPPRGSPCAVAAVSSTTSTIPQKRASPMPSLGFLKKKRTKDSQGSASDFNPTSPIEKTGSPITPTLTKNGFDKASSAGSEPASAPKTTSAMSPAGQIVGQNPNANTQNVPSIQNLIHAPNYGGSQHDSAYSAGDGTTMSAINLPTSKPGANPTRETKGKYTLQDFQIQRTLGTGSFGRVHLVQSKHNNRFYAVKVLKKAQVVKMKQVEHTNDERRMLQRCRHPFLVTLWGTWQDSRNLYMVMDFIEGGELFSLLRKSQVSEILGIVSIPMHAADHAVSYSGFPTLWPSSTLPK